MMTSIIAVLLCFLAGAAGHVFIHRNMRKRIDRLDRLNSLRLLEYAQHLYKELLERSVTV
jgi:hypothetical protein